MGCLFHKAGEAIGAETSKSKEYSWDKREKVNIKEYTIENVVGGEVCRQSGSVNGQQFIIQNCNNTKIYIFDHINTVTIDDCTNCKIVLGAVKGSVFLRDCKECVLVLACGQFRTRDCRRINVFLCCATQPIIEASTSMHFGCYQLYYNGLEDHFHSAGLSIFNNNWSNVHDFTPVDGENNWCLLPSSIFIQDYVSLPTMAESKKIALILLLQCSSVNMCLSVDKSVVPRTWGPHKLPESESCLVTFFNDGQQEQRAKTFINMLKISYPDCLLLLSKEVQLASEDAERVFKNASYSSIVQKGPVVGLHFNGLECVHHCSEVAEEITKVSGCTGLVYVGSNPTVSKQQVESFFNFANMQSIG